MLDLDSVRSLEESSHEFHFFSSNQGFLYER